MGFDSKPCGVSRMASPITGGCRKRRPLTRSYDELKMLREHVRKPAQDGPSHAGTEQSRRFDNGLE